MPAYETSGHASIDLDVGVGDVRVAASDRSDLVVTVRPSDPSRAADVSAAEGTRIEFTDNRLVLKTPRPLKRYLWFSDGGAVDVELEVPTGTDLSGHVAVAAIRATGRLGNVRYKTATGDISVETAADVAVHTSLGEVTVGTVNGAAEITTSSGTIEVASIGGTATIKNSNGATRIGDIAGELHVRAANGRITVDRARSSVTATTANGDVRIGEVARGAVTAETSLGNLDVGVLDGTAVWLDLHTRFGRVDNALETTDGAEPGKDKVELRARTSTGNITIRRVTAAGDRP